MSIKGSKILIVDDELESVQEIVNYLKEEGFEVTVAYDRLEATRLLKRTSFDIVFLDWVLEREIGLEVLNSLREEFPGLDIVVLSEGASLEMAVQAVSHGAYDIIKKAREDGTSNWRVPPRLPIVLHNLLSRRQERELLIQEMDEKYRMIGDSPAMQKLREEISLIAPSDYTVLICGESGTGKELVAHNIHRNSARRDAPFVPVNCSALTSSLLESELFGIEKRVATQVDQRKGKFELANGGTLFLDEIGDLSYEAQAKLLRVLEDKTITRVGGQKGIKVDVRVVAATNRDMDSMIKTGDFREDLRYRLTYRITCPPLREHKEDVKPLAEYLLLRACMELHKKPVALEDKALELLTSYSWPGNVRQLKNVLQWAAVRVTDVITADLLRKNEDLRSAAPPMQDYKGMTLKEAQRMFERDLITRILSESSSNREAAQKLGMDEGNFSKKLKELGLR
ncbi:MAG: sigma-54 dependent transcriptional regulator [Candidatus Abyssubacteria bacterium]